MVSFFKNDYVNGLPISKKSKTTNHRSIKHREIFGHKVPSITAEATIVKKPTLIAQDVGLGSKKKDKIKNVMDSVEGTPLSSLFKNDDVNGLQIQKNSKKARMTNPTRPHKQRKIFSQKVPGPAIAAETTTLMPELITQVVGSKKKGQIKNTTTTTTTTRTTNPRSIKQREIFGQKVPLISAETTTVKKPELITIQVGLLRSEKKNQIKNTRTKMNWKLPGLVEELKDKIKVNSDVDFLKRRNTTTEVRRNHPDHKMTPRSWPHHLKIPKAKKDPEIDQPYNYKYDVQNEAEFNHEEVSSGNRTQGAFVIQSSDVEFKTTYSVVPGSGFQAMTSYSIVSNTGH